ncbi:Chitinase, GH18 family [Andreprevotia lacus DSM 23236]|jgi:GH18 family chitinase|uniref:chitinase n=1 Tax=Andreprevotia lacus DSM 23236 TaxID=1121001 RepID=A0A1W1XLJ8_9NEIS|nr:glycosyl hydrolase family 18 protein [Andreprevotia lacus]SMC24859.1 Chitinase, GH18 family [Andreprevotia lacus DSM 23236]
MARPALRGLLALCAAMLFVALPAVAKPLIVGYYPFWTIFQNQNSLAQIPFEQLDYLTYVYARPHPDASITPGDYVADLSFAYSGPEGPGSVRGGYAKLREIKTRYPHLKTLLSIGGWNWSTPFPAIAADPVLRARFAANALDFIDRHCFDGIEIDWQYPVVGGTPELHPRPDDQVNKALLLQALRGAMDLRGHATGRHYTLSTTLGVNGTQLQPPLTRDEVAPVDFAVVSAFDFQGDDALHTTHSAPLRGRDGNNVAHVAEVLRQRGVPASKLLLALDLEATSWIGVDPHAHGLYQKATGRPFGSWDDTDTGPTGTFTASEVRYMLADPNYVEYWDDVAHASFLYNAQRRQFVTFESPRAASEKLDFADQAGYAGVALWQLGSDAPGAHSLLRHSYRHYHPLLGQLALWDSAWESRPVWLDPLLGVIFTLLALAGGVLLYHYLRRRQALRREVETVRAVQANIQTLLPLLEVSWRHYQQLQQRAGMQAQLAPLAPLAAQLPMMAHQLLPLLPPGQGGMQTSSIEAMPDAVAAVSPLAERLDNLSRLAQTLGEQRSVERMLETVMGFLANEQGVRAVRLMQDGEVQQQLGDWPEQEITRPEGAEGALQLSADKAQAWIVPDDNADQVLAVAFDTAASPDDEAMLRHLLAQLALIRQQLTELTRQPHVLSELYEIASRRERLLFIRADKGYSGIHCMDGAMPLYITLRLRTIRLYFPDDVLLQVHRSYLVNPRRVVRAEAKTRGACELIVGKTVVPVRRQYVSRLRALYPAWFAD